MNAIAFSNGTAFDEFADIDRQFALDMANAIVQRILPRHGIKAFGSSRKETAAHEAGHAIIYAAEGLPVASISLCNTNVPVGTSGVIPFCSGWTECPNRQSLTPLSPIADDERYLRQILSGWVGEVFSLRSQKVRRGSSLDERIAACMLAGRIYRRTGKQIEQVLAEQYAIIYATLRNNKLIHARLTNALTQQSLLQAEELNKLLSDVTPLSQPRSIDYDQAMDVASMLFLISRL
jgi:hypothetical protein